MERLWKEGFTNEHAWTLPAKEGSVRRESIHVVDQLKNRLRLNQRLLVFLALVLPAIHYVLGVVECGLASALVLLVVAAYNNRQMKALKGVHPGERSINYLRSLERWLLDAEEKGAKMATLFYPCCLLIAMGTIISVGHKEGIWQQFHLEYPNTVHVGGIPVIVVLLAATLLVLVLLASNGLYKWEMRWMYGPVRENIRKAIYELEELEGE